MPFNSLRLPLLGTSGPAVLDLAAAVSDPLLNRFRGFLLDNARESKGWCVCACSCPMFVCQCIRGSFSSDTGMPIAYTHTRTHGSDDIAWNYFLHLKGAPAPATLLDVELTDVYTSDLKRTGEQHIACIAQARR